MFPAYRSGTVIDGWTLVNLLGSGGNADVYHATDANGSDAALKVLRKKDPRSEPYLRFKSEIELGRKLVGRSGVVPHLDSSLPNQRMC